MTTLREDTNRRAAVGALLIRIDEIGGIALLVRTAIAAGDPAAARRLLDMLATELEPHVAWEEAGLLARLERRADFAPYVACVEAEHASLLAQLAAIDDAADDVAGHGWRLAVLDLLDELEGHLRRDAQDLLPAAVDVLDAADWAAIEAASPRSSAVPVGAGR